MKMLQNKMGFYIHIPYCNYLCHYCDFAKTANWDDEVVKNYFSTLLKEIDFWISLYGSEHFPCKLTSIFFGGGTPGIFTEPYNQILQKLKPYLSENCEISLETNPNNINEKNLEYWKNAGFNRISIGVQTFNELGLAFLKRDHDKNHAVDAILKSHLYFDRINVDLIYGWIGQDIANWRSDLKQVLDLGVTHLSLYNLIYENQTPIGRAIQRNKISPQDERLQTSYYTVACKILQKNGFIHDEVSNWAQPGFSCQHNWLYWTAQPYIGVGAGAHGFLPFEHIGVRYSYPKNDRIFSKIPEMPFNKDGNLISILQQKQLSTENRDQDSWLIEYVGCGLRCREGIDLRLIYEKTGREFTVNPFVNESIAEGKIMVDASNIYLKPSEWIRETAWSLEILKGFGV